MSYIQNKFGLLAFLIIILASSCEDNPLLYSEGAYVAFESSSSSVSENNTATGVRIYRSSSDVSQPLTVNLTMSAVYASTTDFFDEGADASDAVSSFGDNSSLTIPAGEAYVVVPVFGEDDVLSSGDKVVTITITEVSDGSYNIGLPGPDANNSVHTLTVVDDDCPIDLSTFEGSYSFTYLGADYNSGLEGFDLCANGYLDCSTNITLAVDASDPSGTTAILTHPAFTGGYGIKFITCPQQIEVVQPMADMNGFPWQMQQGSMPGSYNPDTKAIVINGVLGGNGDFTLSLTKVD